MNNRIRSDPDAIGVIPPSVVFIVGSPMYYKAKPQGNIMLKVCKCIWVSMIDAINITIQYFLQIVGKQHVCFYQFAIRNRYKHRSSKYPKRQHWMDWAEERYEVIYSLMSLTKCFFRGLTDPLFVCPAETPHCSDKNGAEGSVFIHATPLVLDPL